MAGTPALRPTAKRFSRTTIQINRRNPTELNQVARPKSLLRNGVVHAVGKLSKSFLRCLHISHFRY